MLNNDQLSLIDKIPAEGAMDYIFDREALSFSQAEIDRAVDKAFEGKVPPSDKKASIMLGAPGAGKTMIAQRVFSEQPPEDQLGIIVVAYNEGGAEDFFEPFQRAMAQTQTFDERLKVAKKYQPVTQRIQNTILKRALLEEFSVLIDITAAGPGAKHMIGALRGVGYHKINMIGAFAPFEISVRRATERRRPADPIGDIVGKRTGVLEWMGAHAGLVDLFQLVYNPVDGADPLIAITLSGGSFVNHKAVVDIRRDMGEDYSQIQNYLEQRNLDQAVVAEHLHKYREATLKATQFLNDSCAPLVPLEPQHSGPAPTL